MRMYRMQSVDNTLPSSLSYYTILYYRKYPPLPPERSALPLITLASDVSVLRLEGTGDDEAEYVTEGGEPEGGDDDEAPVTADEIVERLASEIAARVTHRVAISLRLDALEKRGAALDKGTAALYTIELELSVELDQLEAVATALVKEKQKIETNKSMIKRFLSRLKKAVSPGKGLDLLTFVGRLGDIEGRVESLSLALVSKALSSQPDSEYNCIFVLPLTIVYSLSLSLSLSLRLDKNDRGGKHGQRRGRDGQRSSERGGGCDREGGSCHSDSGRSNQALRGRDGSEGARVEQLGRQGQRRNQAFQEAAPQPPAPRPLRFIEDTLVDDHRFGRLSVAVIRWNKVDLQLIQIILEYSLICPACAPITRTTCSRHASEHRPPGFPPPLPQKLLLRRRARCRRRRPLHW